MQVDLKNFSDEELWAYASSLALAEAPAYTAPDIEYYIWAIDAVLKAVLDGRVPNSTLEEAAQFIRNVFPVEHHPQLEIHIARALQGHRATATLVGGTPNQASHSV